MSKIITIKFNDTTLGRTMYNSAWVHESAFVCKVYGNITSKTQVTYGYSYTITPSVTLSKSLPAAVTVTVNYTLNGENKTQSVTFSAGQTAKTLSAFSISQGTGVHETFKMTNITINSASNLNLESVSTNSSNQGGLTDCTDTYQRIYVKPLNFNKG